MVDDDGEGVAASPDYDDGGNDHEEDTNTDEMEEEEDVEKKKMILRVNDEDDDDDDDDHKRHCGRRRKSSSSSSSSSLHSSTKSSSSSTCGCCPICFLPPQWPERPLVHDPICGHSFCQPCIERVLLSNGGNYSAGRRMRRDWMDDDDDDDDFVVDDDAHIAQVATGAVAAGEEGTDGSRGNHNSGGGDGNGGGGRGRPSSSSWTDIVEERISCAPTVGRCPLCRTPLRLFDLVYSASRDGEDDGKVGGRSKTPTDYESGRGGVDVVERCDVVTSNDDGKDTTTSLSMAALMDGRGDMSLEGDDDKNDDSATGTKHPSGVVAAAPLHEGQQQQDDDDGKETKKGVGEKVCTTTGMQHPARSGSRRGERRLVYTRDADIVHSPLGGMTYVLDDGAHNHHHRMQAFPMMGGGSLSSVAALIKRYHFPGGLVEKKEEEGRAGAGAGIGIGIDGGHTDAMGGNDGINGDVNDPDNRSVSQSQHTEHLHLSEASREAGDDSDTAPQDGGDGDEDDRHRHVDDDDTGVLVDLPYLSYERNGGTNTSSSGSQSQQRGPQDSYLLTYDDGTPLPRRVYFQRQSCHYHHQTRTFHGTVLWDATGGSDTAAVVASSGGNTNDDDDDDDGSGGVGDGDPGEGKTVYGSHRWDYIVQFSSDLRYACGGHIVMHRTGRRRSPLDGRWSVRWYKPKNRHYGAGIGLVAGEVDEDEDASQALDDSVEELVLGRDSAKISVMAGCFKLFGIEYRMNFSGPSPVQFTWPDLGGGTPALPRVNIIQTVQSGVDLQSEPEGPPVGAKVVWTTTDRDYPKIEWTRLTKRGGTTSRDGGGSRRGGRGRASSVLDPDGIPPRIVHFGPPPGGLLYVRARGPNDADDDDESARSITYHPHSVWGNVFVQGLKVGLASYHFVSETGSGQRGAYICYEHPLCALWPRLDDGSPVPSRVPFTDTSWDETTRTFRGTIDWYNGFNTTWQGDATWRYEMVFDTEYLCILSGSVRSASTVGGAESDMNAFGDSLIYVNAAAGQKLGEAFAVSLDGRSVLGDAGESADPSVQNATGGGGESSSPSSAPVVGDGSTGATATDRSSSASNDEGTPPRNRPHPRVFAVASRNLGRRLLAEGASRQTTMLLRAVLEAAYEEAPLLDDANSRDYLEALRRSASRRSRLI